MLRFLHLSDLHIGQARHKAKNSTYELCHADLLNDCQDWLTKHNATKADAIIITGDVAFSGGAQDYDEANTLIQEICTTVKTDQVYVVPGNHDVDRTRINLLEYRRHQAVRAAVANEMDSQFHALLLKTNVQYDPIAKLENYNTFIEANNFIGSTKNIPKEHWFADLQLDGDWKIRLHGLCSVLVCNDDDAEHTMILGSNQWHCKELAKANIDHVVLVHHPFEWFMDENSAKHSLMARMKLFMCGHTHAAGLTTINDVVSIRAGALNPSASEEVPYTYNWIELSADSGAKPLKIEYFPRKWNPNNSISKFCPDDSNQRFDHSTQSVVDWVTSNFRVDNKINGHQEEAAESRAYSISQEGALDPEAKLLLLRPELFQAMRRLVDLKDVGTKGSFGQLLRYFRKNKTFEEAKIERMHECVQRLDKVLRGEKMSQLELDWAVEHIPAMLSDLSGGKQKDVV